jgi:lipopolysaccharide/colanic/teichoic acid biosynthesis glycosyltransferase
MSAFLPHTVRLRPVLAITDAVLLGLASWGAHVLRFGAHIRGEKWAVVVNHPGLSLTAVGLLWALATAAELYEPLRLRARAELAARVLVVAACWGGALALATYLVPAWLFGRGLLLLTTVLWTALAVAERILLRQWLSSRPRPLALVVGDRTLVGDVCQRLRRHPLAPWDAVDGSTVPPADVAAQAAANGADLVVLAGLGRGLGAAALDMASLHFSGVPVVVTSELWAWLDGRLDVGELSPDAFLHQPGFGAVHWQLFNRLTRVLDVVIAALALLPAALLVVLGGLAILASDGRPVFFLQTRVGQLGRGFRILKLRTMVRDAEEDGAMFASPGDRRVLAVGRLLRWLRVDELPQLLNVLRGDMSLVGPRPERPEFVASLAQEIPYYTFRLAVPPGISGWAQVNMPYAATTEEHRRKLEYDLYFIRERSVGLYLMTLLRTVSVALVGARKQ